MASNPALSARLPFAGWVGAVFGWLDQGVERRAKPARPRQHATAAPPAVRPQAAPDLRMLEWDGDREFAAERAAARSPIAALDQRRRRMRDRYVAARFFGIARSAADLKRVEETIKGARLLFDDGQADLALELLELATEEAPVEAALWLARLELLFLSRRVEEFVAAARQFREIDRDKAAWDEIERLGRSLAPGDCLFGGDAGARAHDHYGPWPDLPNWIRAPWDLTAEVMAADFHRAVLGLSSRPAI